MDVRPDHGERTPGSGRLAGRKAVITGGDSGIGRAVALAFAREGADVLISYLPEEEKDGPRRSGSSRRPAAWPSRSPATWSRRPRAGRWCSGPSRRSGASTCWSATQHQMSAPGGLGGITTEQLDRVVEPTSTPCSGCARRRSRITSSSVQAFNPSPHLLDYATTKGGIVTFTKGLAAQLAEKGIRVNSVAPGPVWTPLIPATIPGDHLGEFGAQTPLGRAAQRAELAPFYVFLASGESGYMTAQVLGATGVNAHHLTRGARRAGIRYRPERSACGRSCRQLCSGA